MHIDCVLCRTTILLKFCLMNTSFLCCINHPLSCLNGNMWQDVQFAQLYIKFDTPPLSSWEFCCSKALACTVFSIVPCSGLSGFCVDAVLSFLSQMLVYNVFEYNTYCTIFMLELPYYFLQLKKNLLFVIYLIIIVVMVFHGMNHVYNLYK